MKRKAVILQLTIYFPHPLLHVRTSHNVEGLLFMVVTTLLNSLGGVFIMQKNDFLQRMKSSLGELRTTKNMVFCGLMAALAVVLGLVASIDVGPFIRIGFSGLPNRLVDSLFGPVTGALFGGALDILKYLVKPTGPFFFGFTFNAMLASFIYGLVLYRRPVSIKRVVLAEFLVKLIVNCGLNTLFISMLYGKALTAILPMRALKNLIMLPIDSAIIFFTLTECRKLLSHFGFSSALAASKPTK